MIRSRFEALPLGEYALPRDVTDRLLSPALVIYLDRVRENVRRVVDLAGGSPDRWRPHVKTVKIPEVLTELIASGLRAFKCATTREAEHLLRELERRQARGADLLVAYPLVGPALARVARLAASHGTVRVSVLCEDPAGVSGVPQPLSIFADVNPGMNRTGVPAADSRTVIEIARAAGERFRGLHYYDGQIHGTDAGERRCAAFGGYDRLLELLGSLLDERIAVGELVTSGTPSFRYALEYRGFDALEGTKHRVSPGTVVLHDLRSEQELEDLELVPAAVLFSRVVSHPCAGLVTCDAGSKSLAAEAGNPCAYALGHPELEALGPSEEHLPLRVHSGPLPRRGTDLYLVPRHVCPTVNLAEQALLVDHGRPSGVAYVRARAHDFWLDAAPAQAERSTSEAGGHAEGPGGSR